MRVFKIDKSAFLFCTLAITCAFNVFAQVSTHQQTIHIHRSPFATKMTMRGFLDAENASMHDLDGRSFRTFEPMISLRISNIGKTKVDDPRLVINNKKQWFSIDSMTDEIFNGARTNKEKMLALWQFVRDNRMHAASPAFGCDLSDPVYLLGIFGYGTCSSAADAITSIARQLDIPARTWHLAAHNMNHTFAEVDFGDGYAIIDPDAQVFYLDYDNRTLLGKEAIAADHFLIHRTHHFGKATSNTFNMATLYDGFIAETGAGACGGASLDIHLKPGESIIYRWQKAEQFFHVGRPTPPAPPFAVANNKLSFEPPFSTVDLSQLLYSFSNIKVQVDANAQPFVHAAELSKKTEFIIKIDCPFILLDSRVIFSWFQATAHNRITLDFSTNGADWRKVWRSAARGSQQTALNLTSQFENLPAQQRHAFFLRFKLQPKDSVRACGISAIKVVSTFQASRFFMPRLHLGENMISYADENGDERNVEININWQESTSNRPPRAPTRSQYPTHNGRTESLQFTFKWRPAIDPDGDAIVDYYFQLSDRQDMLFPLSTNFDRYVSAAEKKIAPIFTIPWPGLLNDGEKYYWRVRALDARGAWSDWSHTWSFVAHGVMPPIDGRIVRGEGNLAKLEWSANPKGARPVSCLIYGSNEANGFIPDSSNLIGTIHRPPFLIASSDFLYFRVAGVDSFGCISGPSRVIRAAALSP